MPGWSKGLKETQLDVELRFILYLWCMWIKVSFSQFLFQIIFNISYWLLGLFAILCMEKRSLLLLLVWGWQENCCYTDWEASPVPFLQKKNLKINCSGPKYQKKRKKGGDLLRNVPFVTVWHWQIKILILASKANSLITCSVCVPTTTKNILGHLPDLL